MMNLQRRRRGFSLIELLIVIAIILIIITIALPRLSRARMFSRETAAIGAIRTLHTMQVQYYSQYGRYAASLTEMGPPTSGAPGPAAADLIDGTLAGDTKSGHKFTMTGNASGYVINVVPESYGNSGSRTFYSDQTMTIRQNYGWSWSVPDVLFGPDHDHPPELRPGTCHDQQSGNEVSWGLLGHVATRKLVSFLQTPYN